MNTAQAPVRCLIIQTAGLQATLESLMALRAAKQLYPELELHFLTEGSSLEAARRVDWLEETLEIPTRKLIAPLVADEDYKESMKLSAQWIGPLCKDYWDLVINWSYSESSSYLTALVPGRVKLGLSRAPDLRVAAIDGWSHYIQGIIQPGVSQNIHVIDVLTTQLLTALQIHLGDPTGDPNSTVTSRSFFTSALYTSTPTLRSSKKWIGIQFSASSFSQWSKNEWAIFLSRILKHYPSHGVCFLGTAEESNDASELLQTLLAMGHSGSEIQNLVGLTDFDSWVSAVGGCGWVISADSPGIQLASILGVRVIQLTQKSTIYESGPYGNGHYIFQDLDPQIAQIAWDYASNEWAHRRQTSFEHFAELTEETGPLLTGQVLRSRIRPTDEGGGVIYEPLIKRKLQVEDWTAMVVGYIARAWYCGWVPPITQELSRDALSVELIQSLRQLSQSAEVLEKICKQASQTADTIQTKASKIKSHKLMDMDLKSDLIRLSQDLVEMDQLMERVGETHTVLKAFSNVSKILMHNIQGDRIEDLGKAGVGAYQQIIQGVSYLTDWVKETLKLARPTPVHSAEVLHIRPVSEMDRDG